ncbi:MAG: hypothetical protein ABI216_22230 [Devosia sp.]
MGKLKEYTPRGHGKVAFWAQKESIKKMLDEKHTVKATYLKHKDLVPIKIEQFRRYVKIFIRGESTEDKPVEAKQTKTKGRKEKKPTVYEELKKPIDKEDMI